MSTDAADLAHELRTPLNAMLGALSLLERSGLSPAQQSLCALVQEGGAHMARLLDELLHAARLAADGAAAPQWFSPAGEIAAAARLFAPAAGAKGLRFSVTLALDEGVEVCGVATHLRQIVTNLVSNAVKFTGSGAVRVHACCEDARLLLRVEDTGPGLSADQRARLFHPFQQAHGGAFHGSGLGLAIAQKLARAMGGEISVHATPGAGACFTLSLPARAPALRAGLRVLLADDHPPSRQVVRLILETQGVDVIEAADGPAALEAFRAGRFDAVLLDQRMPGLSGLAVRAQMRALEAAAGRPTTPIALLSADPALAGAPLIAKPISAHSLLAGVAELVRASACPPQMVSGGSD